MQMIVVLLSRGLFALIDDVDADLAGYNWAANKSTNTFYAQRTLVLRGVRAVEILHRVIAGRMGITGEVDHKNRCGLDDRRENLREATRSQNQANKRLRIDNTSGFKGVHWSKSAGKWSAGIRAKGARHHLGVFDDVTDAARAYDAAARDAFGEFAALNFPETP